jgi:hypothetical protein
VKAAVAAAVDSPDRLGHLKVTCARARRDDGTRGTAARVSANSRRLQPARTRDTHATHAPAQTHRSRRHSRRRTESRRITGDEGKERRARESNRGTWQPRGSSLASPPPTLPATGQPSRRPADRRSPPSAPALRLIPLALPRPGARSDDPATSPVSPRSDVHT